MTDPDRLAEIKAQYAVRQPSHRTQIFEDVEWLVGEVERLRGLLARLEWAGRQGDGYGPGADPACPVCESVPSRGEGHDPDCWLAAELHR